ncbi:hypothetical protein NYQ10_16705 [Flavobacterium johnsoniae]|nr:hypothetical protein [Flavobacterium johnsoniae]WJS93732.1 hypothetical protein NYQ10_16705 [Flavobacterium johnsoniae]
MDSKIIKILIVGLTAVLSWSTFSKNDFFKAISQSKNSLKTEIKNY